MSTLKDGANAQALFASLAFMLALVCAHLWFTAEGWTRYPWAVCTAVMIFWFVRKQAAYTVLITAHIVQKIKEKS